MCQAVDSNSNNLTLTGPLGNFTVTLPADLTLKDVDRVYGWLKTLPDEEAGESPGTGTTTTN